MTAQTPLESPAGPWWVIIVIAFFGLLGKAIEGGIFRRNLMVRIGRLEAKDEEQQRTIEGQEKTIKSLELKVEVLEEGEDRERRLKHYYRNKLFGLISCIGLYRMKYGRDAADTFDWNPETPTPFEWGDVQAPQP